MKNKLEDAMTIIANTLFIILWIISIVGVYKIVQTSLQIHDNKIKLEVKPPVEINEKLLKLTRNIT
jgi:hypothetical protein